MLRLRDLAEHRFAVVDEESAAGARTRRETAGQAYAEQIAVQFQVGGEQEVDPAPLGDGRMSCSPICGELY